MLPNQCPCSCDKDVTINVIDPCNGQCPPPCEIAASATITIQEPAAILAAAHSLRVVDESGTTPAGVRSISFLNDGSADARVNGVVLKTGTSLMFPFLGGNTVYGAMTYDATGTELRIDWTTWGT